MHNLKLSLLTLPLLIVGCGGGSSDGSSSNNNEAKTINKAVENLSVIDNLSNILSIVTPANHKILSTEVYKKATYQKVVKVDCKKGGTATATSSDDGRTTTYAYDNCQDKKYTFNGELVEVRTDDNNFKETYNAHTVKSTEGTRYYDYTYTKHTDSSGIVTESTNGTYSKVLKSGEVTKISYENFTFTSKETADDSWTNVDGSFTLDSKCTNGRYTFETVEKLLEAQDGTDNTASGILKLNTATYSYANLYVTIIAGSEEETVLETELKKRMSTVYNSCNL